MVEDFTLSTHDQEHRGHPFSSLLLNFELIVPTSTKLEKEIENMNFWNQILKLS